MLNNFCYKYANVMQQMDNSSFGPFTITYATNITFGIGPKKSKYILSQIQLHLQSNINYENISPFPKYSYQNSNISPIQLTSSF
jgi:hypothetical protein